MSRGKQAFLSDALYVLKIILYALLFLSIFPALILGYSLAIDWKYDRIAQEIIDPKAAEYIELNYPDNDFILEEAYYSFKDNCFYVQVQSPSSPDTYFSLSYDYKTYEFLSDTYETVVQGGINTRIRLVEEYDDMIKACLGSIDGLSHISCDFCRYSQNESSSLYFSPQGLYTGMLTVDYPYDVAVMANRYGYLEATFLDSDENINIERVYDRLMEIDQLLTQNGIGYYVLKVTVANGEYPNNSLECYIYGVRRHDLTGENPLAHLQEMWEEQEAHRQALTEQWEESDE